MKLKYVRYFGRFYEVNGRLGWMPWHKALIVMLYQPAELKWVSQSDTRFTEKYIID